METYFDFILQYEKQLRGVVRNSCRQQYHLIDEIWSDVVLVYTENALATYNSDFGQSVEQHVFHTIKWYVRKWLDKRYLKFQREPLLADLIKDKSGIRSFEDERKDSVSETFQNRDFNNLAVRSEVPDIARTIADRDEVQTILGELCTYDRTLLQLRYVLDWSYVDIADKLGCDESTVRKHCKLAIERAQEIAYIVQ